jgi:signal peptidase I
VATWLYLCVIALLLAASAVLSGVLMWVAGRVWRVEEWGWPRALVAALALMGVVIAGLMASSLDEMHVVARAAAMLIMLAGMVITMKLATRAGWWRSAGVLVVYMALGGVANGALAAVLRRTIMDSYRVTTASMAPTIPAGGRFLVDRTLRPRRWDVVAFRPLSEPGTVYIKRLIGLPGETVEIRGGMIWIDGRLVAKEGEAARISYEGTMRYKGLCRGCTGEPMRLGAGECYVLGDNTAESMDSRNFPAWGVAGLQDGAVPWGSIVGVVRVVYAPVERARVVR